jgi:ADP-ribose pyrophosphatase YjhB (NUDIX family)
MIKPGPVVDEVEVAVMAAQWGAPERAHFELSAGVEFLVPWDGKWRQRRGEVMFLLPRAGGLLLHRKVHYPADAWRLPTGGIELHETVRDAIDREPVEEFGLALPVRRYAGLLTYDVVVERERYPFATHIFLLAYSDAPLQPSVDEEVAATLILPLSGLDSIARQLEALDSPWRDWGRFRAIAHRAVQAWVREDAVDGPSGSPSLLIR